MQKTPIRPDWAHYYEEALKAEGATHYSHLVRPPEWRPHLLTFGGYYESVRLATYKYTGEDAELPSIDPKNTPELKRYYFLIAPLKEKEDEVLPRKLDPYSLFIERARLVRACGPIDSLDEGLEDALSSLDDSPQVLREVLGGSYEYDKWDFLYFSAITITTVGYGDYLAK